MAQLQRQQAQDARQGQIFAKQMEQADALTEAYKRMGLLGGDGQTTGQMPAQASQSMAGAMGGDSLLNIPGTSKKKNSMIGQPGQGIGADLGFGTGGSQADSIAGSMGGNSLYNFGRPF